MLLWFIFPIRIIYIILIREYKRLKMLIIMVTWKGTVENWLFSNLDIRLVILKILLLWNWYFTHPRISRCQSLFCSFFFVCMCILFLGCLLGFFEGQKHKSSGFNFSGLKGSGGMTPRYIRSWLKGEQWFLASNFLLNSFFLFASLEFLRD